MLPLARSLRIRRALLLATGQTTSYGSGAGVDDGALKIGELHRYTVLTSGQYAGSTNIVLNGKTDVHSNACVFDEATGLMWSRTESASVGPTSNGLLPWTTNASGEGIFPFAAAVNAALLAGYSNWRIPNDLELASLREMAPPYCDPNTIAFPVLTFSAYFQTSTTNSLNTANNQVVLFSNGAIFNQSKTLTGRVLLVRGPL